MNHSQKAFHFVFHFSTDSGDPTTGDREGEYQDYPEGQSQDDNCTRDKKGNQPILNNVTQEMDTIMAVTTNILSALVGLIQILINIDYVLMSRL